RVVPAGRRGRVAGIRGAAALAWSHRFERRAYPGVGNPLLVAHSGARRAGPRFSRGRRGDDRGRQYRRGHARHDDHHRAGDFQGGSTARTSVGPRPDPAGHRAQRRGRVRQGCRAAALRMILPLKLEDVLFVAGGRVIIERISAEIGAGPSTIILGANGAGKSVLMRLMHGLLAPASGKIAWRSTDTARLQAMVFQRPVLLRRSALANVTYALKLARVPHAEREHLALEALESVGLAAFARRPARVLSGGEQQRLALARAWALHPEVLFLDEPTASLDPTASREIERVIQAFDAAGTKIIMATHNLGQARRLGDEVLYLHQGRLLERAPVDQFFSQPSSAEAAAFIKGELPWV